MLISFFFDFSTISFHKQILSVYEYALLKEISKNLRGSDNEETIKNIQSFFGEYFYENSYKRSSFNKLPALFLANGLCSVQSLIGITFFEHNNIPSKIAHSKYHTYVEFLYNKKFVLFDVFGGMIFKDFFDKPMSSHEIKKVLEGDHKKKFFEKNFKKEGMLSIEIKKISYQYLIDLYSTIDNDISPDDIEIRPEYYISLYNFISSFLGRLTFYFLQKVYFICTNLFDIQASMYNESYPKDKMFFKVNLGDLFSENLGSKEEYFYSRLLIIARNFDLSGKENHAENIYNYVLNYSSSELQKKYSIFFLALLYHREKKYIDSNKKFELLLEGKPFFKYVVFHFLAKNNLALGKQELFDFFIKKSIEEESEESNFSFKVHFLNAK